MDEGYAELAREIHKRNNRTRIGMCTGEVTGYEPVTITVAYGEKELVFTNFVCLMSLFNGGTGVVTGDLFVSEYPFELGEKYICMFSEDNQGLFVLGRAEIIKDLNILIDDF